MSPKIGRPTDNPKSKPIHVRLDNETSDILEEYCTKNNVSRAEAIRIAIKLLSVKK